LRNVGIDEEETPEVPDEDKEKTQVE